MLNRLKKSDFVKNTAKLATGTTIAQAVAVISSPITYRIYSKEAYGTLGLYMAITGVLGVFSTMQYTQTILLEKDEDDAKNALWLNRLLNTSFSLLVLIALLLLSGYIGTWFNNPMIQPFLWMIPISIFFSGQNEILRVLANRLKQYNILTFNTIITALLVPALSIGFGLFFSDNPIGLFIGLLASQIVPALYLSLRLRKKYDLGFTDLNFAKIKAIANSNKNFPIFSLPSEFVNRFTAQLPVFVLSNVSGPATVGVYGLCKRMLGLPVQFIGGAIGTVYQQKSTQNVHESGNCQNLFKQTAKSLGAIAIMPTLIIMFFGPELFSWFFGAKWYEAGEFARIFIVMFSLQLVVSPLTYIFFVRRRLAEDFIYHIGILLSILFSYFVIIEFFETKIALISHAVLYSFWYIVYFVRSYQLSKNQVAA